MSTGTWLKDKRSVIVDSSSVLSMELIPKSMKWLAVDTSAWGETPRIEAISLVAERVISCTKFFIITILLNLFV
ncbi:hypothetical protein M9194_10125 [Vibrio sp. S4M6]|nr:hypothetical protein [Vibrio sinus]MCL9781783.1 hypothetical protein [Vibrio sinus]